MISTGNSVTKFKYYYYFLASLDVIFDFFSFLFDVGLSVEWNTVIDDICKRFHSFHCSELYLLALYIYVDFLNKY